MAVKKQVQPARAKAVAKKTSKKAAAKPVAKSVKRTTKKAAPKAAAKSAKKTAGNVVAPKKRATRAKRAVRPREKMLETGYVLIEGKHGFGCKC